MDPGIYLFHGEEPYLIHQKVKEVISSVNLPELNVKRFEELNGHVIAACRQVPCMADMRVIIVECDDLFSSDCDILVDYIKTSKIKNICICISKNLDRRKKAFKAFSKVNKSNIKNFKKLRGDDLKELVQSKVSQRGKVISDDNIKFLINRIGYYQDDKNLFDMVSGIDIMSSIDSSEITKDVICEHIEESIDNNIFKLTNLIGNRDTVGAFKHLKGLIAKGHHPLALIGLIQRQYRLIYKILVLEKDGKDLSKTGLTPNQLDYIKTEGFTIQKALQSKDFCQEASSAIKSGTLPAELSIELLLSRLILLS